MLTPTISGRESSLTECVASVSAQTFPVKHLVMLDGDRRGPATVRNDLFEEVDTEWILFLDDDDLLDPDYVEHVFPFMDDADVVYTWCRRNYDYDIDVPFDPVRLRGDNFIPVTACVRSSAFRQVGGFRPGPYEDWDLWVRLLDEGARFYCTQEKKWEYRRPEDGRNAEARG